MPPEHPGDDPSQERRWDARVDLFEEISCEMAGVVVRSGVADLGVGGMFIDTLRTSFPVGSRVLVRFGLRPGEPPVVATADVRYVQERIGMGLRFAALAFEDRERIAAYVDEATRRKSLGSPPVRKSARVSVQVPVRVRGPRLDGPPFDERTRIITLSKYGACLVSGHPVDVGTRLVLETAAGRSFEGNVVWIGSEASRSEGQVGVQCRGLAQSLGFQFP
ncbi:MAG TPA: PilZ domain-containing protein [Vicinamibacteria bacterium]|nr:PilZ domain-containing protein [Vicinamibacteria bacterium]